MQLIRFGRIAERTGMSVDQFVGIAHLATPGEIQRGIADDPVQPRPDLRRLAEELDALESTGEGWQAAAPGALTPQLRWTGEGASVVPPELFLRTLRNFLQHAEPAWDPFEPR